MRIWELETDFKVQSNVKNFQRDYYLYFDSQFMGTPIEKWGEVEMEIYKGAGQEADALKFVSGKPIFSKRAVDALSDLLTNRVELLPLKHNPFPIFAVNVLNVIDGIDHEITEKKTLSDGTFIGYEKYAFHIEKVTEQPIFKIQEQLNTMVFVSDEFKKSVEANKLKGFRFYEVWDSKADKSGQSVVEAEEVPLTLTYDEAMKIVEQGEKAVVNANEKWQKDKSGNILLGYRMTDGSYKWMNPAYIPIPHLNLKWGVTEKSEI